MRKQTGPPKERHQHTKICSYSLVYSNRGPRSWGDEWVRCSDASSGRTVAAFHQKNSHCKHPCPVTFPKTGCGQRIQYELITATACSSRVFNERLGHSAPRFLLLTRSLEWYDYLSPFEAPRLSTPSNVVSSSTFHQVARPMAISYWTPGDCPRSSVISLDNVRVINLCINLLSRAAR